jgi:DNA modification methylase
MMALSQMTGPYFFCAREEALMTKARKEQLADNVILYCGDSREIIFELKGIDAVVTDPPYGIEDLVEGYGRTDIARNFKHTRIANDQNLNVVSEVMAYARKVLARNAWAVVFYSCRITPKFFKMMESAGYRDTEYFGEVIWDKKAVGLGTQIRYQHENAAFYRLGKPEQLMDLPSVTMFMRATSKVVDIKNTPHPHEKPDQVMQNIVQALPSKLILDPFCGTGSTGAAAVKLKKGFVGIEINPKYFEMAIKKVGAALKQPVAFWEE